MTESEKRDSESVQDAMVNGGLSVDLEVRDDKVWLRRLLPFLVIVLGAVVAMVIFGSKKPPDKKKSVTKGTLVETIRVGKQTRRVVVLGYGTVQPTRMVALAPEVAGRVTWVNPSFVVGGLVKKGAPLVRISAVDYKLAVEQSRAQIAQAQRALAEAESNASVATREWGVLGKRTGRKTPNPLTLGKPQLKQAQALLASAKAAHQLAKVRLSRTLVRAPFNMRVRNETVEIGQFAVTGQPFGQVFGTDQAEVLVPLKVSELAWIDIPRLVFGRAGKAEQRGKGSQAWVILKVGSKLHRRRGRLMRTVGEIDATGRLTKVVISLADPYNLEGERPEGAVDFEIGSFVQVAIDGREIADVIPIPVQALRLGNKVWVADSDNKLQIRKVAVARLTEKEALVKTGLQAGDQVVLSSIGEAVDGMRLRVTNGAAEAPKKAPVATPKNAPPKDGGEKSKVPSKSPGANKRG